MLTQLQFTNWRSLQNVTIDNLTPITVFIGANSSGKTNIVEALNFIRYASYSGLREAVYAFGGREKVQSLGIPPGITELKATFKFESVNAVLIDKVLLEFAPNEHIQSAQYHVFEGETDLSEAVLGLSDNSPETMSWLAKGMGGPASLKDHPKYEETTRALRLVNRTRKFVDYWQILRENFMPPTVLSPDSDPSNLNVIDTAARNVSLMLDYMRQEEPSVYDELKNDLRFLLPHVTDLDVRRDDRGLRISVMEPILGKKEAPTISSGTARLIAMLTAYYILDMRTPDWPGLVVIEEPDTAINPLLLRNFVELLRTYTERENRPRQFILTTHNPRLLDWLEPEEVRVVERDLETGQTSVQGIPDYIREIWLEDHKLGDAWLSRVIGGIPQE